MPPRARSATATIWAVSSARLDATFTTLQNDPSSQAQQSAVLNAAGQLSTQINSLAQSYTSARQGAQDNLVTEVNQLNAGLTQIGQLSDAIISATAAGQSTATLQTQRDTALAEASPAWSGSPGSSSPTVTSSSQPPAACPCLFIGGPGVLSLASANLGPDSAVELGDVPQITLAGQTVTDSLTGGSIGANVTLRDVTLPTYQAELDQFSQTLTTNFSAQGLTLFSQPDGSIPAGGGTPLQSTYVGYSLSISVNPAVLANTRPWCATARTPWPARRPAPAPSRRNTDPTDTGFFDPDRSGC